MPDGPYLLEKTIVSYVTSGRDLLRPQSGVASTMDLLLVADPAYDDQEVLAASVMSTEMVPASTLGVRFTPLPGTAAEARIIPPLVGGTKQRILTGREATKSTVCTIASPRILHLATHGFFLQDEILILPPTLSQDRGLGGMLHLPVVTPGQQRSETWTHSLVRSGLALAGANHADRSTGEDNGLLTALEVTGMNLYGTELVVLSACQTGLGQGKDGEGVYGLRRAFVLAGARNLVMSLWPVKDQITLTQMEEFYRGYGQGLSPAEAMRQAQLQTLETLRAQTRQAFGEALVPVKLWAPFIVQQTDV
jgi:CHAT domain-containing protein